MLHDKDTCIGCGYCSYAARSARRSSRPTAPSACAARWTVHLLRGGPEENGSQAEFEVRPQPPRRGQAPACAEMCSTKALLGGNGDVVADISDPRADARHGSEVLGLGHGRQAHQRGAGQEERDEVMKRWLIAFGAGAGRLPRAGNRARGAKAPTHRRSRRPGPASTPPAANSGDERAGTGSAAAPRTRTRQRDAMTALSGSGERGPHVSRCCPRWGARAGPAEPNRARPCSAGAAKGSDLSERVPSKS